MLTEQDANDYKLDRAKEKVGNRNWWVEAVDATMLEWRTGTHMFLPVGESRANTWNGIKNRLNLIFFLNLQRETNFLLW